MVWDAASGTSDQHGSLTLGADDNGVDFTAFGDSSGKYVKWDSVPIAYQQLVILLYQEEV